MGTRTERLREAQSELSRAGRPAVREAERREPESEVQSQEPETGRQERPAGPSAWHWSRGADLLALLLLFGLLGVAGAAAAAGVTALAWLSIAAAALLVVALVVHAATAGRRFGRP